MLNAAHRQVSYGGLQGKEERKRRRDWRGKRREWDQGWISSDEEEEREPSGALSRELSDHTVRRMAWMRQGGEGAPYYRIGGSKMEATGEPKG